MVTNKFYLVILTLLLSLSVRAQVDKDEYTADDLALDSVYPKVDYPESVLNKKLNFTNRFEVNLERSSITDEVFYNNTLYGARLGYHWNEFYSVGLSYQSWESGLNSYSEDFKNSTAHLDFTRAPAPKSIASLYMSSQYFYGKISLSRDMVFPIVFLGRYSLGMIQYENGSFPLLNYSLGYQMYFTKSLFFELGYGISVYQGYNAASKDLRAADAVPEKSSFSKTTHVNQNLNLIFGYLF